MGGRRWLVIEVAAQDEPAKDLLVAELASLGAGGIQEIGLRLEAYLPPPPDPDAFAAEVRAVLEAVLGEPLRLVWRWQEEADWGEVWKQGLRPRRIGERLLVTPSWFEPPADGGDLVIVIDPEMAFGTGEHETTRLALALIESAVRPGERVLDVGAGSAILAIAAALLGAGEVLAVENDADALDNARGNVTRNGVADRVEILHAEVDDAFLTGAGAGHWDLIAANVLSGILTPLLPGFRRALAPGGRLILGGILTSEAAGVTTAAEAAGLRLVRSATEGDWWSGLLQ
jgi:ribosomal protein L11 methyltransferase